MAKIVSDTARRLSIPPFQVFVRAYAFFGLGEGIARLHWEEDYKNSHEQFVPDQVEAWCLSILRQKPMTEVNHT